jgi:hypothetical protein
MTMDLPRFFCKSRARAASQSAVLPVGAEEFELGMETPTAEARAAAKDRTSVERSGRRWSADAPVLLGMLSTT